MELFKNLIKKKTYKITVIYVDFPMGASLEYTVYKAGRNLTFEEATVKQKELTELATTEYANEREYPVYYVRESDYEC